MQHSLYSMNIESSIISIYLVSDALVLSIAQGGDSGGDGGGGGGGDSSA